MINYTMAMDAILSIVSVVGIFGLIFLGHYFIYRSTCRFFYLKKKTHRILVASVYLGLTLNHILATILAHFADNFFTHGYYYLTGLWFGGLMNLILVLVGTWAIYRTSMLLFKRELSLRKLGMIAFSTAIILSVYGVWNASHPRLKRIDVAIEKLPPAWKGKRIAFFSDVHLGQLNRSELLKKTVEKVNDERPEAVFIAGDLFDGTDGELSKLAEPLNNLRSSHGTFFVTGNHENILGKEKALKALEVIGLRALEDETVSLDGLQVVGLSYPEWGKKKDIENTLAQIKLPDQPSILLYHSPSDIEAARRGGISLQLSGHTHKGQVFPVGSITKLIFKGYDYGLHQESGFAQYTTSGLGSWGTPMRSGNAPEIVIITLK